MSLTDFLLARLDEDEATARAAQGKAWTMLRSEGLGDRIADEDVNAYARRFLPARVLARCEADRRIVALRPIEITPNPQAWNLHDAVLRRLALPYADHPDYREEWKP